MRWWLFYHLGRLYSICLQVLSRLDCVIQFFCLQILFPFALEYHKWTLTCLACLSWLQGLWIFRAFSIFLKILSTSEDFNDQALSAPTTPKTCSYSYHATVVIFPKIFVTVSLLRRADVVAKRSARRLQAWWYTLLLYTTKRVCKAICAWQSGTDWTGWTHCTATDDSFVFRPRDVNKAPGQVCISWFSTSCPGKLFVRDENQYS